jgi:hypothetical protein
LAFVAALLYSAIALYATSGGPQYPVDTDLSGSYSGVMKPRRADATPTPSASPEDHNSLGVFSVTVPQSGLGNGAFVLFSHGEIYSGSISAEADPTRASLNGVLTSSSSTSAATNELNGKMDARAQHTIDTPFSSVGVQLRGHAFLDFEDSAAPDVVVRSETMRVRGFKQSAGTSLAPTPTASASATPTPTP